MLRLYLGERISSRAAQRVCLLVAFVARTGAGSTGERLVSTAETAWGVTAEAVAGVDEADFHRGLAFHAARRASNSVAWGSVSAVPHEKTAHRVAS